MSVPTTYQVRARTTTAGRARIDVGSESVSVDASWAVPPSGLPGPADLLAAAFAACLLKNVERSSRLLPFRYEQAEADVQVERQDSPPRFTSVTYELRVVTDEPERRLELLHHNLRRYGTVYNTLVAVCEVDGRIVALAPPPE